MRRRSSALAILALVASLAACGMSEGSEKACDAARDVVRGLSDPTNRAAALAAKSTLADDLVKKLDGLAGQADGEVPAAVRGYTQALAGLRRVGTDPASSQQAVDSAGQALDTAGAKVIEACGAS